MKTESEKFLDAEETGRQNALNELLEELDEEDDLTRTVRKSTNNAPDLTEDRFQYLEATLLEMSSNLDAAVRGMTAMAQAAQSLQNQDVPVKDDPFETPPTSRRPPPSMLRFERSPPATVAESTAEADLRKTLRSELIRYDGSRNVVLLDNFCRRLETYFAFSDLSDAQKVIFASSLLVKTAESWAAANPPFATFDSFKIGLTRHFRPANATGEARSQLIALCQKGSARSYLAQFQDLSLRVENLSEVERHHYFIAGLKSGPRLAVKMTPGFGQMSFLDITERAILADETAFEESRSRRPIEVDAIRLTANPSTPTATSTTTATTTKHPKMTDAIRRWCFDNKACFFCRTPNANHTVQSCPARLALSKN